MDIKIRYNHSNNTMHLTVREHFNILYAADAVVPEVSHREKVVAELLQRFSHSLLDGSVTLDGLN